MEDVQRDIEIIQKFKEIYNDPERWEKCKIALLGESENESDD